MRYTAVPTFSNREEQPHMQTAQTQPAIGSLVWTPDGMGIGRVASYRNNAAIVSLFRNTEKTVNRIYPPKNLAPAFLAPQTRVYFREEGQWRIGRVVDYALSAEREIEYRIRLPNGKQVELTADQVEVRCLQPLADPTELLLLGGADTQFLHDRRRDFLDTALTLRKAARGLTGAASAAVDLLPHQLAAVRRILFDPVQRYLLADDAGMGKTVEAGMVIRQCLLDDDKATVLVVAPDSLTAQWRRELAARFDGAAFEGRLSVVGYAAAAARLSGKRPTLLVVDEAQFVLAPGKTATVLPRTRDRVAHTAREAERLLLLSSAPYVDMPDILLALLRAVDPDAYDELEEINPALPHPRLIRNRRADSEGWEFPPRGPKAGADGAPDMSHLRVEVDDDEQIPALCRTIEQWRQAALTAVATGLSEQAAAARLVALFEALAQDMRQFAALVAGLATAPLFEGEKPLLQEMTAAAAAAGNGGGRGDLAAMVLTRLRKALGSDAKIVAFASDAAAARKLTRALRAELGDKAVHALADPDMEDEDEDDEDLDGGLTVAERFCDDGAAWVLVCDRGAEDGVDLHFADAILHYDLPFSAERLERRISRLDRFGRRKGVIRHRVLLPYDEEDSLWQAWCDLLADAFQIFSVSLADLRFLLADLQPRIALAMLRGGAEGLTAMGDEIRAAIAAARESQARNGDNDDGAALRDAIEDAEEDETLIGAAIDGWVGRCLRFDKRNAANGSFELAWTRQTLLPTQPWKDVFAPALDRKMTVARTTAVAQRDVGLLRPGHPLFSALEQFMSWDDQGTAFATWRVEPGLDVGGRYWLGFRLCWLVQTDISAAAEGLSPAARQALRRRANEALPPRLVTRHVDMDLRLVEDARLAAVLERPYDNRPDDSGRIDINLGSRPQILAAVVDALQLGGLCRRVRAEADVILRADPDFAGAEGEPLSLRLDSVGLFVVSAARPQDLTGLA